MVSDKSCRVFVGNLAWSVGEEALQNHMSSAGNIVKIQILKYKDGFSKGCGIVTYENPDDAQKAISTLSDTAIESRLIFVREDRENEEQVEARGIRYRSQNGRRFNRGNRQPRMNNDQKDGNASQEGFSRPNNYRRRGPKPRAAPAEGESVVSVYNLDISTTWKDLKDYFREAGDVRRADVIPAMNGERSGKVHFSNMKDAMNAVQLFNEKEFKGSKIKAVMEN